MYFQIGTEETAPLHLYQARWSDYLSFHTASPPREDYVQVDCDLKSKCKNRKKEKLKGDSVKIASVIIKNRLKTAVLLYYDRRWSRDRTATLN